MNGRVYDPELGRFLSADPFVQAPYNSQSYNRYSCVFNNPLSFTDPSGYSCESSNVKIYDGKTGTELPSYSAGSGATTLCGQDAITFGQYWQNYMNSYQDSMINMGGFWGGVGYVSIATANQFGVADALGAVDDTLNGNVGGAIYSATVVFVKPLKAVDKAVDLAKGAKAAEKNVEKALDANPLQGATYTDKVKRQMNGKDLDHNFPSLIDQKADAGNVKKIIGGDGIERTKVELPGNINGKDGNFSWIIEPDNTINHRQFERVRN